MTAPFPAPDASRAEVEAWRQKQFADRFGPTIDRALGAPCPDVPMSESTANPKWIGFTIKAFRGQVPSGHGAGEDHARESTDEPSGRSMSDDDRKQLGRRLRDAREYLGLSQDEAAKAVGLTRSAISLIESGQRRVDAIELCRFAELYQRPMSDLAGTVEISAPALSPTLAHLVRTAQKLTDGDRAELVRFAEFLATKLPSSSKPPER